MTNSQASAEAAVNASAPDEAPAEPKLSAELTGKHCFVVMPFRTKIDRDGKPIDFERVYTEVIERTVLDCGLTCEKADSEPQSGLIHQRMVESLLRADLVIADITAQNANVFYELGVRHTAKPVGTIIIARRGTSIPFDINGMLVLDYVETPSDPAFEPLRAALAAAIRAVLASRRTDSLVHSMIPGLNVAVRSKPIAERRIYTALLREAEPIDRRTGRRKEIDDIEKARRARLGTKQLGIITGDLIYVEDVDVWVNPESTRMEMARVHDDSVSATIRYHGAKLRVRGEVVDDRIGRALAKRIGSRSSSDKRRNAIVEAATVVITNPGELRGPNKVRRIFHVAAQHGEPSKGYVTVRSFEDCVKRVLEAVDEFNMRWQVRYGLWRPLRSVIFPLFGTRSRERDAKDVTMRLVQAAKTFLETWPDSKLERVYFLAYTDADYDLCEAATTVLGLKLKEETKA